MTLAQADVVHGAPTSSRWAGRLSLKTPLMAVLVGATIRHLA